MMFRAALWFASVFYVIMAIALAFSGHMDTASVAAFRSVLFLVSATVLDDLHEIKKKLGL